MVGKVSGEITKVCRDCGQDKPASDYWETDNRLQTYCKTCHSRRATRAQKRKRFKSWIDEAPVIHVMTEGGLRHALTQPEPFYADANRSTY